MTSKDTRSVTSSQAGPFGNSRSDKQDGQTTGRCGPDHALASHLAQPENTKELMIQGTFGRTYIDSSVPLGRLLSWENRFLVRLAMSGSTESAMILKRKVTPRGRQILRLVPSTRLINGRDFGGSEKWMTPATPGGGKKITSKELKTGKRANGTKAQIALENQMDLTKWLTPTTRDHKDAGNVSFQRRDGTSRLDHVSMQMIAQSKRWPTPTTRDGKDAGPNVNPYHRLYKLPMQLIATGGATGSNATTGKSGAPNPAFAFWLMGFSYPWMLSVARALQTYKRPSRKAELKRGA